ncbi:MULTISPECIES: acyl-CoA dehydrogenase family protein [unclassified Rhizobacter]|uniref:acyl-CoA dehydrogenase family protein n=1 Tax=unclassified Rhizobacter TaxID=2640088 RepID=UPI0006FCA575|nr:MULTISPECIES: acyl-CoA dehydrogenase family protein [unclassified Rhizobacter]KQU74266.1 acyl-CoA dehydrogenase [Rhizobacter sp. Root29]KQW03273.1 acyl-CoA dehydrogenase [Rhizobacter sp. Root1238]KRB14018.1 acyl-CoA dehydrogenase [Rhizobacter sp. Root16D2]
MDPIDTLARIVTDTVEPLALRTDREGRFPRETITALGEAGLLGLVSAPSVGGLGLGLKEASQVVSRLAQACPSTAMIVCMHYCAVAVIESTDKPAVREAIARGRHLSTLAFSEADSRSHFWAPTGTARTDGNAVLLDARKSWVTSAFEADSYVWSSKPLTAEGASTLWFVDAKSDGLSQPGAFDGLGLRGNASTPITAQGVRIGLGDRLGEDGKGFDTMMGVVLPWFSVLSASCSAGLMEGALSRAIGHVGQTRHLHLGSSLADLPTIRAYLARARIKADMVQALIDDTLAAIGGGRADTMLRVLEVKAAAAEAALEVTDTAMRVCGGAAFRKEAGIERLFRDARASSVMAPTSDVLYDFIGKAITGLPLF